MSTSKIFTFLKSLRVREIFLVIVVILNIFILFFMESNIKENKLETRQFNFEYGDLTLTILVNLLFYICVLRLILFVLLNFKIQFYGYWRQKITQFSTMIDKNTLNKQEKRILAKFNETSLSSEEIIDIIALYVRSTTN